MLLDHDVVADGEAKAGPFSGGFCREEGIEHLLFHFGLRTTLRLVLSPLRPLGLRRRQCWDRPPFGLPEMPVASGTSRLSCGKPREARVFTPIRESSGESRLHKPARETSFNALDQSGRRWALGQRWQGPLGFRAAIGRADAA